MSPLVDLLVDFRRLDVVGMLRDHVLALPAVQFVSDPVHIERLVREKGIEFMPSINASTPFVS